ncbi:MAG: hypothetical protein EAY69_08530 [Cytophagales bacterium]|nr:MAG: hypothetical protein EAY69_08530 [Cytophagales bacterium]
MPPPVVINPCDTAKIPTANFKIYDYVDTDYFLDSEAFAPYWQNIDTDTIFMNAAVFEANEYNGKYKWQLGAETITNRRFSRTDYPLNSLINVSLQMTKKHQFYGQCFPTTDTVFTKYRSFKRIDRKDWRQSKVIGKYQGKFMHKPNEVKILELGTSPGQCPLSAEPGTVCDTYKIIGLDGVCSPLVNPYGNLAFITKRQLYFSYERNTDIPQCTKFLSGIFRVHGNNDDSLTVVYKVYPDNSNPNVPMYTFKGKRIQ